MDDLVLKRIHDVELEILDVVDRFCREHKIHYSLYCGTMLGAVRHDGFIPWDDDIDICMLRSDYNRFIKLWLSTGNKEYILQNKDTDASFTQSFTKIRKNHTTFLQEGEKKGQYHTGIFIDILPLDRIPDGKIAKLMFKWNLMNYLLFTREFIPPKSSTSVSVVSNILLSLIHKDKRSLVRKKYLRRISKFNKKRSLRLVSANSLDGLNHEMPSDLPSQYKQILFEGRKYLCYSDCDGLLSAWYGSYMELPPENQRVWRHRPVVVDFEKNLDEIE